MGCGENCACSAVKEAELPTMEMKDAHGCSSDECKNGECENCKAEGEQKEHAGHCC